MKKFTFLLIWAITMPIFMFAQSEERFILIFEDNFENGLNSKHWSYTPRRTPDWAKYLVENNSETVEVKNGYLYLRAIKNQNRATDNVPYLTGGVKTEGKVGITYGKVEVRAKVPTGQGSFPAIWMMPLHATYGGWPNSGEIDIMERLNFDSFIYSTVHTDHTWNKGIKNNPKSSTTAGINGDDFNIFGLEWYPDRLDFFVNGKKTLSYPRVMPETKSQWPYDKEFYLILNTACDGSWGGPVTDSHLPFEMVIDWVKMYDLNQDGVFYDIPGWEGADYNSTNMKDTYVEKITSAGLVSNFNYEVSSKPEDYYIVHDEVLEVESGSEFSLNLKAFSLGEYSESAVKQDLRYTAAYAYVDYDGDGDFETTLERIGDVTPKHNVGGNFDVLDATFNFEAPEVEKSQDGRIRIVYSNAWGSHSGPNASIKEGVAHDFKLKFIPEDKTSFDVNSFNPSIYRIGNSIMVKDIYSSYTVSVYDFTGKLLSNKSFAESVQSSIEIDNNQKVIVKILTDKGEIFTVKF